MLPATSPEWFAQRQALQDGLGAAIAVRSFELPPSTLIEEAELPANVERATSLRAYIDLRQSGGRHFIDLSTKSEAVLHVTARSVLLQTEP
jgi:type VI secretion system protein